MNSVNDRPPRSVFEKIWDTHVVADLGDERRLIHIDRHILHEASSPQAFDRLRAKGRRVDRPDLTFATIDHIVSTAPGRTGETFPGGVELVEALRRNCSEFGIHLFDLDDPRQGIVHVVAVERGIALPGCTVACGDSHTSTMGGIGALAWGAGVSEVEHVLTTQTMARRCPATMRIHFEGLPERGVSAKDLILHLIGKIGAGGGAGHVVEYAGPTIAALPVEGRLTICNMSIEFGARAGLIAPDDATVDYVADREFAPTGTLWDAAVGYWSTLRSDPGAPFDREVTVDCAGLRPQVTWGISPQYVVAVDGCVPAPDQFAGAGGAADARRSLEYMGLTPGMAIGDVAVDVVFIGSCTNGRLSDLEEAARVVGGRKIAPGVRALAVPGSRAVKEAAEARGLDQLFIAAGFQWREPGCSMCLSMNDDSVPPGARCVSTSNRNFEGRQGRGSRTHLASPATAAASAITGTIADPRRFLE
jgi:3-isopropylmalate/(R)-2-methylmalate dehydratase large subunit